MAHTFFGGVFPATRKESTRRKPLAQLSQPPREVAIPLLMCSDGPSVPVVRPGDPVSVGQVIARRGDCGVAIHASVSGRVTAIQDRPHPWGGSSSAILIENDGQNTPCPQRPQPVEAQNVELPLLLDRVQAAGIVGMRGEAAPTWEKLARAAGRVDTLIVNVAECEPYVTADYRLLLERSEKILLGASVVARCLGAQRAVIVTEGDKLRAVESLERRLLRRGHSVQLCTVRTRYPLGAEKQIIQTVTGREVPPGGSALDASCVVLNVATLYAVQDTLFRGRPLTHRAVTVTGGAVTRPRNLWVPIGTPLRILLESAGGLREEADLMLTGGPMMGVALEELDAPVIKDTNSLICLTADERKPGGSGTTCIRCGKCVSCCPMHLAPVFVRQALEAGDRERLAKYRVEDCISCGCCSFICPAQLPLVETMIRARAALEEGGDRL